MSDQLSRFRKEKPTGKPNQSSEVAAGKKAYEAHDMAGKPVPYLEILCLTQPSQAPQARFLMAVVFSADYDQAFTLLYSFMAVEVRGKNLREMRRAIQNGRCEFIQEWHENEFALPATKEPVIESIKFITGEKLDDILSSYRGKK